MFSGGHLGFKCTEVAGVGVRKPLPTPLGRSYTLPQVTLKIETKMAACLHLDDHKEQGTANSLLVR